MIEIKLEVINMGIIIQEVVEGYFELYTYIKYFFV